MTQSEDDELLFAQFGPEGPIGQAVMISATTGSPGLPALSTLNSTLHPSPRLRSYSLVSSGSAGIPIPASTTSTSSATIMPMSAIGSHMSTNQITSQFPTVTGANNIMSSQPPILSTNQIPSLYTPLSTQHQQLSPFPISSPSHDPLSVAPPPLPPHPSRPPSSLPASHPQQPPWIRSPSHPVPSVQSRQPRDQRGPNRIPPRSRSNAPHPGRGRQNRPAQVPNKVTPTSTHLNSLNQAPPTMSSFNASSSAPNGDGDDMDPSHKKKTCVTCGKKVYDNFTECPHCTTLFRDPAGKVVRCGRVGKKVCLQCGFSNPVRCFTCKKCDYLFQPKPKIVKPPAKRGRKPKNKNASATSDRSKSNTRDHPHNQHLDAAHTLQHNTLRSQEALHDQDETRRSSSSSPASPPLPFASAPSHVHLRVRSPSAISPNGPPLHASPPIPSIPGLTTSPHGRLTSLAPTARTASNSGSGSASASGSGTDGGMGALHSSALPLVDHPKLLPMPSSFVPAHQAHRLTHEHEHTHGHRHRSHLHPR